MSVASFVSGDNLHRYRPLALAAIALSIALSLAGCRRTETASAQAENRPPAAVSIAPIVGLDEPVIIEATGSFQADESSDVAPESAISKS